jgi:hypothetical protein
MKETSPVSDEHPDMGVVSYFDEEKAFPRSSTDTPPPPYENVVAPSTLLRERIVNLQCILLNTGSTVAIVFMNKM